MKRWIKQLAHELWGHDWEPWETFMKATAYDSYSKFLTAHMKENMGISGIPVAYQARQCKICGKVKYRMEKG